ncbi:MAG: N-acetyltransferase [Cytophagales bacterium]|nr:N-acetyltransferase [Rhizobacter sp.]
MPDTTRPHTITHNTAQRRFETTLDGHVSVIDYRLAGKVMRITHTGVDRAVEGRGIASTLVATALAHARAQGLKVDPQCPYARAYMERHPETQDLRV